MARKFLHLDTNFVCIIASIRLLNWTLWKINEINEKRRETRKLTSSRENREPKILVFNEYEKRKEVEFNELSYPLIEKLKLKFQFSSIEFHFYKYFQFGRFFL